jgi:hypothetical protein
MDIATSKKTAVLITDRTAHASHARSVLGKHGITIITEYDSLYSTAVIRKSLKDTGNTIFIRKSFSRMVHDWGPPFLIILDYRLNLGASSINDSDNRKLLRTFFISLVIMMKKNELDKAKVNFILLTDNTDFNEALNFQKNPVAMLDILKSDNEEINNLICGIGKDPVEFNRIFRIIALPDSAFENTFEKAIIALTGKKDAAAGPERPLPEAVKETPKMPKEEKKADNDNPPVAHVVYRIDDSLAYIDGAKATLMDKPSLGSLVPGEFYVLGRWEYRNQADVARILGECITNGMGGKRFHKNDEIIINLNDHCTIDATVIASLVMLLTKQLSAFNTKKIIVSYKNADILEKGSGYILIKKHVRHAY